MSPKFKHRYEVIDVREANEPGLEWDLIAAGDTLDDLLYSATYVLVDIEGNVHAAEPAHDTLAIDLLTELYEVNK